MNIVKFRAWDDGQMFYNVRAGGMFGDISTAPTAWFGNQGWVNLTGQPHTKIMQFTGMRDSEGKDIYENDILESPSGLWRGYIEFNSDKAAFMIKLDGIRMQKVRYMGDFKNWKVIGDIHSNPDLMEVVEDEEA